jgi:hypothetical protein
MERELRSKEQQLSEVTKKQGDLEMKLLRLNLNESETKNENERLQKVEKIFIHKTVFICSFYPIGKDSVGRTITGYNKKSRRIEELHHAITKSNEKRKTR